MLLFTSPSICWLVTLSGFPVDGAHLERNSVPRDRAVHGYVRWSTSSCGESLGEEVAVGRPVEICDDLDFF